MKKLFSFLLFIGIAHCSYAIAIQQITVSGINGTDINIRMKVTDAYVFEYYTYNYEIVDQTIYLNICYLPYLSASASTRENDFIIPNINTGTNNFSLVVKVYKRTWDGTSWLCNNPADMDSATLPFSTPLSTAVMLSSSEFNTDDLEVVCYPNPTTGTIYLSSKNTTTIQAYDNAGRKVRKFETLSDHTFDLSEFDNGIYFITAISEDGRVTKKIILK